MLADSWPGGDNDRLAFMNSLDCALIGLSRDFSPHSPVAFARSLAMDLYEQGEAVHGR